MEGLSKRKERSDMILEPFQVMVQLAVLSNCPIGTKISVSDNILHIQKPTMIQGVVRWWNSDNKDDLYYLFHAIRRYYQWYKSQNHKIFNYVLKNAILGINQLINTYGSCDRQSITHTLSLYKNILDLENPELFKNEEDESANIDSVFKNIQDIYDDKSLKIIYNMLHKIDDGKSPEIKNIYIGSLEMFLIPLNIEIKNWIQNKLTT
jgi:hypothetical protein